MGWLKGQGGAGARVRPREAGGAGLPTLGSGQVARLAAAEAFTPFWCVPKLTLLFRSHKN